MKTQIIIANTSFWGCLILATTTSHIIIQWLFVGLAILWLFRHIYLDFKS